MTVAQKGSVTISLVLVMTLQRECLVKLGGGIRWLENGRLPGLQFILKTYMLCILVRANQQRSDNFEMLRLNSKLSLAGGTHPTAIHRMT